MASLDLELLLLLLATGRCPSAAAPHVTNCLQPLLLARCQDGSIPPAAAAAAAVWQAYAAEAV
jgi:hypothetical protein